ncbi:hypothetical protein HDU98_005994, partial [Podochytrium sp. JEL0797]
MEGWFTLSLEFGRIAPCCVSNGPAFATAKASYNSDTTIPVYKLLLTQGNHELNLAVRLWISFEFSTEVVPRRLSPRRLETVFEVLILGLGGVPEQGNACVRLIGGDGEERVLGIEEVQEARLSLLQTVPTMPGIFLNHKAHHYRQPLGRLSMVVSSHVIVLGCGVVKFRVGIGSKLVGETQAAAPRRFAKKNTPKMTSAFREFLLSRLKPKTAATATAFLGHARIASSPDVSSVDEASFVTLLLQLTKDVPLERFDAAARATDAKATSQVRLRHALPAAALAALADECIARSKQLNDAVAGVKDGEHSYENTIKPFADEDKLLTPLISSFDFPNHVSTNKEIRDASSAADTKFSAFNVEMSMRKDVFMSVQKYAAKNESLAAEDQRLVDRLLRDFKRNGLDLSESAQSRITQIKKEMSELSIQYSKNLGEENTKLEFTDKELDGMPADFLEKLPKSADGSKYVVGLKYTEAPPVLKLCNVDSTRRAMETAFNSRCLVENTAILEKLVQLRQEQATLLGFPNHASYMLDVRMAKTPETVQTFLKDLNHKLQPLLSSDLSELLALKKKAKEARNEPFDGVLHQWDVNYYMNQVEKEKFEVDHEEIKRYFPLQVVTEGLFEIYQTLLSLRFKKVQDAEVWHEDVQMYAVHNSSDDSLVGYFYMDLHPRDGKYGHAAVFGLQPQCDGQLPVCALVANFSKPTATAPSLLLHSEVVTYFHEFGHVFHQICSKVKLARFAGTAVERDFVECPSQMLENWCWEPTTLNLLAGHVDDRTRKIPDALMQRLVASRNANSGYTENRQLLLGLYDQAIHSSSAGGDIQALWPKMQKEVVGIEATAGTFMPSAWGHLAGGYDAQYYGYMFSQVYATDMFYAKFKEGERLLDPQAGMDYRTMILARGGSRDAIESLREFLGREPSQEAFLKSKGFLLFADDTAVIAKSGLMQAHLDAVMEWAGKRGVKFGPSKSYILFGPRATRCQLKMGDDPVQAVERATYLGMEFNGDGVDLENSNKKRVKNATNMLQFMVPRGFNGYGNRPLHSLRLYPLFIRSMMEYGWSLRPMSAEECEEAQRVQNRALRALFSVGKNTSIASLHVVGSVMPIRERNLVLNASFLQRLHFGTDDDNLAIHCYRWMRARLLEGRETVKGSILHASLKGNTFWLSVPLVQDRNAHPMRDRPLVKNYQLPLMGFQAPDARRIDEKQIDEYHFNSLEELVKNTKARSSKILKIPKDRTTRHSIVESGSLLLRKITRPIIVWIFGNVCVHQECKSCGEEISRQHGIDCAQVLPELLADLGPPPRPTPSESRYGATALDLYIRATDFTKPESLPRATAIAKAIEKIRTTCLGHQAFYDASAATQQEEIDAIMADIDPSNEIRDAATGILARGFNPTRFDPSS